MNKQLQKLKKTKLLVSIVLIIFACIKLNFATPLKKGIYQIENHRNGGSIFVDETGKIILKSDPKADIGVIRDLFTDEIRVLYKKYDKEYTEVDREDYYGATYHRSYVGLVPERTVYYDLSGNEIGLGGDIIAVVGENIILSNGNVVNWILNAKYRLNSIKGESKKIEYKVASFTDKVLVSEIEFEYSENSDLYKTGAKGTLYVYDKNLSFIKKIDEYCLTQYYNYENGRSEYTYGYKFQNNGKNYIIIDQIDQYVTDEYGYDDVTTKRNILNENLTLFFDELPNTIEVSSLARNSLVTVYYNDDRKTNKTQTYDLDTKKFVDVGEDGITYHFLSFENDNEKLEATLYDDKNTVLNDIVVKKCAKFMMGDKKYYYVQTDDSRHFIYNEKGNRVKIFNESTNETYKILYSDEKYLAIKNNVSEPALVFDKDFSLHASLYSSNDKNKNFSIKKVLSNKYYLVNGRQLYDEKFKEKVSASSQISIIFDKYIFVPGKDTKIYDENLKVVKEFKNEIANVETMLINGKTYIRVSGKDFSNILDSNYNEILSYNRNKDNVRIDGLKEYNKDGIKYINYAKHILIDHGDTIDILDLNLKKVGEINEENNQSFYMYVENNKNEEFVLLKEGYGEYGDNSSLYKIGTGFVLKDFYFIGDMKKEYFTFANGFYYGLMDYDLNILCQYSIFDKIDDDATYWDDWY